MGRPRIHGEQTRRRLLDTAARILADEGPRALSNRRLAAEVDVTTRAIYSLFGSKQGLLGALFQEAADLMTRHHLAVAVRDDPVEEIPPLAAGYRRGALESPSRYQLLFEGGLAEFTPSDEDRARARASFDRVIDTVRRCVESGRFPGRDVEHLAFELWALVHGLASLELHGLLGPPDDADRRWSEAVAIFIAGARQPVAVPD